MTCARNVFGLLAFVTTMLVIGLILSPWVPDSKDAIANVILGNVLGWPATVLAFHFGSTQSSADKNRVIEALSGGDPPPPPTPIDWPEPAFGKEEPK